MSALERQLGEYLAVRRALGYKLERAEKLLAQFLGWLDQRELSVITTELALEWATLPPATGSNWHRHRLTVVRGFAAHLHAIDPAHEVPPADLLPPRPRRAVPYLYTNREVLPLIDAASIVPTPHRAATLRTLIGLLAVTGIRIGEAICLDRSDLDYEHGLLVVRESKFGKSRELALHPSTIAALRRYRIVEYDPPRAVTFLGENATVISRDRITFEPTAAGTRVTYDADLALKGPFRIADPLLGLAFNRVGDRALDGLRRTLAPARPQR